MRIVPSLAALLLGVATAFLVACGSDGRIPASDASRVDNALNEVATDFRAGNCQAALQAVAKARGALLNLPDSVDTSLRDRLRAGVAKLSEQVPATCGRAQTQQQQPQQQTESTQTKSTDSSTTDSSSTDTGTSTTDSTGTTTGETTTGGTTTGGTATGTPGTTTGGTDSGTGGTPPDPGAGG
jgi:hypothetical protein